MDAGQPEALRVRSGRLELAGDGWTSRGEHRGSVLLLHGAGQRRFSWSRTARWLAGEGWSAYAFDARGHGDSDRAPGGDYSLSGLVDDAMAIVETLDDAPILVGASMGGTTALLAEAERGPVTPGLVLVDVVARLEAGGARRIGEFMRGAPDGFADLEEAADAIAAYNPQRGRPKSVDGLRKNLVRGEDGRWRWHWDPAFLDRGDAGYGEDRYERACAAARSIRVPTLLVRGGRSDLVSREGVSEMQGLIPHARSVEVGAAGHMIAGDDNDIFTSELLRFVREAVPPRSAAPAAAGSMCDGAARQA